MLARHLSHVLVELSSSSDVTTDSPLDMDQRFESLRAYGLLPRGRENRDRVLSNEQIAVAAIGMVAAKPGWAGHVATLLAKLRPFGDKSGVFGKADTLAEVLGNLLATKSLRDDIVSVRLSVTEVGTNSNGMAVITYDRDGVRKQLPFVRREAFVYAGFDVERRNAPVSRELVLNRRFFDKLARDVATARAYPVPPMGDGSEYDGEDSELQQRQRLGVTPLSRYLNIGVDNQKWPRSVGQNFGFPMCYFYRGLSRRGERRLADGEVSRIGCDSVKG